MARPPVTTGSTVEAIDAVAGPTFGRPVRKALMATTVETTARAAIQAYPVAAKCRLSEPVAAPATVRLAAAPVAMSALRTNGSRRVRTRSARRM